MITNFRVFGWIHIFSLVTVLLIGAVFIVLGCKAVDPKMRRRISLIFAGVILLTRSARYVMDAFFGVFEWTDLFSLHICHIDWIFLLICFIRPSKALFQFCFLIGIPMALAVALFPGTNHPEPGLPRAILFIMSHAMLVMGAIYLAVIHRFKILGKAAVAIIAVGNVALPVMYMINKQLQTNYLYIMKAPKGTVIASLERVFGWPWYVLIMDAIAIICILAMMGLRHLLMHLQPKGAAAAEAVNQQVSM